MRAIIYIENIENINIAKPNTKLFTYVVAGDTGRIFFFLNLFDQIKDHTSAYTFIGHSAENKI